MATATTCCFKLPPPSSTAPSHTSQINQIPCQRTKEVSWRNQCLVGMACMIIGSEIGPVLGGQNLAIAENLRGTIETENKSVRWSDARACPPWRVNSIEIIVPENLPRPSNHRKSESISFSKTVPSNRTVRLTVRFNSNNCFSM